jgi:hypothetical protein
MNGFARRVLVSCTSGLVLLGTYGVHAQTVIPIDPIEIPIDPIDPCPLRRCLVRLPPPPTRTGAESGTGLLVYGPYADAGLGLNGQEKTMPIRLPHKATTGCGQPVPVSA